MGSRRGKEGLFAGCILGGGNCSDWNSCKQTDTSWPFGGNITKERNRTDANGTVCPVFMEFMVVMPGSKKQGKKRTGYSLSDTRLAFVPLGTQDTDPADRGWCVDGNAGWIWHLHQQLFFGKYWKKNKVVFPVWEKILLGLTTGKRRHGWSLYVQFLLQNMGESGSGESWRAACSGDYGNFPVEK